MVSKKTRDRVREALRTQRIQRLGRRYHAGQLDRQEYERLMKAEDAKAEQ